MLRQQKAEGELIGVYRSLIAVILIAIILGVFAYRYFAGINQAMGTRADFAYNRFLKVLVVVRSQWLAYGKPEVMELDWKVFDSNMHEGGKDNSRVRMSSTGRPLPETLDALGCKQLWQQLMGDELNQQISVEYHLDVQACRYVAKNLDSISYQLSSGRVLYIPKNKS